MRRSRNAGEKALWARGLRHGGPSRAARGAYPSDSLRFGRHPKERRRVTSRRHAGYVTSICLPTFLPAAAVMHRLACTLATAAGALALGGCATVTGEPTQRVSIVTVDATQRPVDGMRCRVVNASEEYFGNSPMHALSVRRSASDLEIECRRGSLVARGTAVSRGGLGVLQSVLPGGTAMLALDHLTGYRYSYPAEIELRVGEHLVFDASAPRARGLQAETGQGGN
jgi:hypothetical protein